MTYVLTLSLASPFCYISRCRCSPLATVLVLSLDSQVLDWRQISTMAIMLGLNPVTGWPSFGPGIDCAWSNTLLGLNPVTGWPSFRPYWPLNHRNGTGVLILLLDDQVLDPLTLRSGLAPKSLNPVTGWPSFRLWRDAKPVNLLLCLNPVTGWPSFGPT